MMKDLMIKIVLLSVVLVLGYGLIETLADARTSDESPTVIKAAAPPYPPVALAARIEGKVVVEVKINAAGEVTSETAIEGHVLLRMVAEKTASRWRFVTASEGTRDRFARLIFVFRLVSTSKDEETIFSPSYQVEVTSTPTEIKNVTVH
jgi:TonB family protein